METFETINTTKGIQFQDTQELPPKSGQSVPEMTSSSDHQMSGENKDNQLNERHLCLDENNRTSVEMVSKELQELKSIENLKNKLRRSETNVRIKGKKLNELKAQNERLKKVLLISQKKTEILIKIKECFEEMFENLLSFDINICRENREKLNELRDKYQKIFSENESTIDLKYKSDNDFNKIKRRRGRPRKEGPTLTPEPNIELEVLKKANKSCHWPGCSYQCSRTKILDEHINSAHTGDKPYSCPKCVKSFGRSNTLDVHLKSCHSDVRKYKCTFVGCEVTLKTKIGLSIHNQRHSGEKLFRCQWEGCSYRGMTKQRLEIHILNHTGERPYKCQWPGCDASFTSSDCLRSHQKRHSDDRPYICDWPGCDSAFKANRALTIHKVIHTNEKVFKCMVCDFRCNRYHILATHRLIHTGGKKFICQWPGCDSRFDRRNKLEMHLLIHRGEKPHKCEWPGCEKRFVEKGNMRKHYNSVHTKT